MRILAKPSWLKKRISSTPRSAEVTHCLRSHGLHTVCEGARCPNKSECWGRGTATFMILGSVCTRHCRFCAVGKGVPAPPSSEEPQQVAQAAAKLGLRHVVITSVTRDDLPGGGLSQFAQTIAEVRRVLPGAAVEILTPDFAGIPNAAARIAAMRPDVFGHNVETVPRLYSFLRPQAQFSRSLGLLAGVGRRGIITKSGIMLGLGETKDEIAEAFRSLRTAGVSILVLGQYLQATMENCLVVEYINPQTFDEYKRAAQAVGFDHVVAGPFVRSSYEAEAAFCAVTRRGAAQ